MEGDREAKKSDRQKAEQYQKILESLHEGYLLVDQSGDIKEVNPAYCRLVGYSRQELLSMNLADLRSDISSRQLVDLLERLSEGQSRSFESQHQKKDGATLTLNVSAAAIERDNDILIAGLMWDITEEKIAQQKLKLAKQRFQSLFEHNPHSVYILDLEGNYQGINPKMEMLTGYSRAELLDLNFAQLITEKDLERTRQHFEQAVHGNIVAYQIMGLTKQGQKKPVHITNFPMIVDGEIEGVFGIAEDITEQVNTHRKLREANKQFESLFKHNPHPVFFFDLEGHILDANESLEQLSDYTHEELLSLTFPALVSEKDRPEAKRKFEATLKGEPQTFEIDGLTKQGTYIPVQIIAFPMIVDDEMIGIYAIAEDISERKESERKLKESEERWYRLIENSPQSVVISVDKNIEYINKAGVKLLGYDSQEDVVGQSLLEFAHPDNWDSINKRVSRMLEGKHQPHEDQKIIDQKGSIKHVIVHSVHIKYKGQEAIQSLLYDVTDRKQKEELIRDSLKEKEILLQEIHHRVKNNMAVISGLLELQALNTTDQNLQALLKESQMRIHSMAMIHEKLYASQSLAEIQFNEYAKELVEVIMDTIGDIDTDVTVRYRMGSDSLNINQAIPCGLILNELVTNCYKHAFDGRDVGTILISFSRQDAEIKMSVEDNGAGLSSDFDLRNEEGLGMTIIQTLVKQLEGELTTHKGANSTGACFVISFEEDHGGFK